MAILQTFSFNASLCGDGVSSTINLDVSNWLKGFNGLPNSPSTVIAVTPSSGVTLLSASISNNILQVTFNSAPANNLVFNLAVALGF